MTALKSKLSENFITLKRFCPYSQKYSESRKMYHLQLFEYEVIYHTWKLTFLFLIRNIPAASFPHQKLSGFWFLFLFWSSFSCLKALISPLVSKICFGVSQSNNWICLIFISYFRPFFKKMIKFKYFISFA